MSFGILEGAYFVGRQELLTWLNDFLKVPYTKVEQTANGAAACQIMDSIYPGKVPLHKVNFNATQEYEFINNYKVLQSVFTKVAVDKSIPVDKLIKAKYQDNLEWLQWLKRYWDLNYNTSTNYDAVARRQECGCVIALDKLDITASKAPQTKTRSKGASVSAPSKDNDQNSQPAGPSTSDRPSAFTRSKTTSTTSQASSKATSSSVKPAVRVERDTARRVSALPESCKPADQRTVASRRTSILQPYPTDERIREYQKQIAELRVALEEAEKQREFYFHILLAVETLCNEHKDNPLSELILRKLAGEDAAGDAQQTNFLADEY